MGVCFSLLPTALRRITREMATHDMAIKQNGKCEAPLEKKEKRESCSTGQTAISDRPAPEEPDGEGCSRADHTIQTDRHRYLNDSFKPPSFLQLKLTVRGRIT